MKKFATLFFCCSFGLLISCVPAKKLEDARAKNERLMRENEEYLSKLNKLNADHKALVDHVANLEKVNNELEEDTAECGMKYRKAAAQNERLNELYEGAVKQYKDLLANSSNQTRKLNQQLAEKEKDLLDKEQRLSDLESDLEKKKRDLAEKEKKIDELQSVLFTKDSAANALRAKIKEALIGFNDEDLSVEMKNGKVYVSLSEQLLFKSGSADVDPKGADALGKLARVLNNNKDIQIMIEGHTDNVPYKGSGEIKDNWDLSVKRATSIVRLLHKNKVDPKRITAAGRGEFHPVATNETAEGRSKNRRTEIILSPKLDEVFKILNIEQ